MSITWRNGPSTQPAIHVPAGEGRTVWVAGDTYTIKSGKESTNGSFALVEATVPPGAGPPPHIHAHEDEAYYMLSGELEVLAGEQTMVGRQGDFFFIPRGSVHRFRNTGLDVARLLFMFTPGGFEGYFQEIGHAARPGELPPRLTDEDVTRSAEAAPRYGVSVAWDDPALRT
jgi:quercetin dioxygenase-like cupin family protein